MSRPITGATLRRWLGINLYRIRHEQGLTQTEAAERADLNVRFYQRCEHGEANASIATLTKLANGFGVDPRVLVERPPRR